MSWTCGVCTFENPAARVACEMCNAKRSGGGASGSSGSGTSASSFSTQAATTTAAAEWVCPTCTFSQNSAVTRCQACETPNPHSKVSQPKSPTTSSSSSSGGTTAATTTTAGPWTCSQCTFVNTRPTGSCEMCNARNEAFPTTSYGGFGSQDYEYDAQDEVFGQSRRESLNAPRGMGGAGGGIAGLLAGLSSMGGGQANPLEAMKKTMLDMILPALQSHLTQTSIPASEGKVDAGGVVGQVAYRVGEIKCSRCVLDDKHVQLTLDPQGRFNLTASEIVVELAEFKWAYDKLNNLKFSSSGSAECAVRGCSISVVIKLGASMMPEVEEVKAAVKELDVNIRKTKLKLLYDLLLASFKGTIKAQLQAALEKATMDAIQESTRALQ